MALFRPRHQIHSALWLLGAAAGPGFEQSFSAGTVADHLGKKKGLALCAVCFALSSAGMLFASNLHQFVVWRLIGGLPLFWIAVKLVTQEEASEDSVRSGSILLSRSRKT